MEVRKNMSKLHAILFWLIQLFFKINALTFAFCLVWLRQIHLKAKWLFLLLKICQNWLTAKFGAKDDTLAAKMSLEIWLKLKHHLLTWGITCMKLRKEVMHLASLEASLPILNAAIFWVLTTSSSFQYWVQILLTQSLYFECVWRMEQQYAPFKTWLNDHPSDHPVKHNVCNKQTTPHVSTLCFNIFIELLSDEWMKWRSG